MVRSLLCNAARLVLPQGHTLRAARLMHVPGTARCTARQQPACPAQQLSERCSPVHGVGPTNVHPRILAAQAQPMLGYFQAPLLDIMDEIQEGLRCVPLPSHRPGSLAGTGLRKRTL